jgi:hypothetical protein
VEQVSKQEQDRLEKLLRKHRKKLLALPNVRAVDIGLEFTDGEPTGRLALRVHVTNKVPKANLKRTQWAPEELDGVPVDVIQLNPVLHLARTARFNPVIGGVQIMNTNRTLAGTLGMIVLDGDNLQPLAISNHHVMMRTPSVAFDVISQPGTNNAASILGRITASDRTLDCAVCLLGARPWSFDIYGVGAVTGWTSARIGMKVVKSGLTSGVTWGIIDGLNGGGFTVVPDSSVPAIGEMSLPGDSGSIWMELTTNRAVGLHFAGEAATDLQERALAKHIGSVIGKLNVIVFDGAAIGLAWIGGSCHVKAQTSARANCHLKVIYPSGRTSTAKGLGNKTARADGWVEWIWKIGTHTKRAGAGTGAPLGRPLRAILTLPGQQRTLERHLEGTTSTR